MTTDDSAGLASVHAVLPVAAPPTPAVAAERLVEAAFGLAAIVTEIVVGALSGNSGPTSSPGRRSGSVGPALDVALGAAWVTTRTSGRVVGAFVGAATPLVGLALDPPLIPHALRPIGAVRWLSQEWRDQRPHSIRALHRFTTLAAPDAAATAVDLLPVALIVDRVLHELDLDRIVVSALDNIDLDTVGVEVLSRVDLEPIVDAAVAQLDIEEIVGAVIGQLDLTSIVIDQVDLKLVVTRAMEELDLTTLVKQQVDLIELADYVVDGIDLQEIIRESTGSIATTAVQSVRIQSVEADEMVNRVIDKFLLRRRSRKTETGAAHEPSSHDGTADHETADEAGAS